MDLYKTRSYQSLQGMSNIRSVVPVVRTNQKCRKIIATIEFVVANFLALILTLKSFAVDRYIHFHLQTGHEIESYENSESCLFVG